MTIAVIGAGAAGLIAAGQAAQMGAHVILFEEEYQGGTENHDYRQRTL